MCFSCAACYQTHFHNSQIADVFTKSQSQPALESSQDKLCMSTMLNLWEGIKTKTISNSQEDLNLKRVADNNLRFFGNFIYIISNLAKVKGHLNLKTLGLSL